MAEALSNLICNAIIHSQSPDVIVSVERAQGGVRVAVEDQGSGDVTMESVPGKGHEVYVNHPLANSCYTFGK